jgi:hypothetical protein
VLASAASIKRIEAIHPPCFESSQAGAVEIGSLYKFQRVLKLCQTLGLVKERGTSSAWRLDGNERVAAAALPKKYHGNFSIINAHPAAKRA